MEKKVELTKNQLARLPQYLAFFKKCVDTGLKYINAGIISTALSLSEEQVRKDIQVISFKRIYFFQKNLFCSINIKKNNSSYKILSI